MTQPLETPCEGALELLQVILDHVAHEQPVPTHVELAERLNVTQRTIERWIRQLREANMLHVAGRKRPHYMPRIGKDRERSVKGSGKGALTDLSRSFPDLYRSCPFCGSGRHETPLTDSNRSHGGGGESLSRDDSTTTRRGPPPEVYTETGRFLVEKGFSRRRAAQFQHIPLDVAEADIRRRRDMGQGNGAIVLAWDVSPPSATSVTAARSAGPIDVQRLKAEYGDLFATDSDAEGL